MLFEHYRTTPQILVDSLVYGLARRNGVRNDLEKRHPDWRWWLYELLSLPDFSSPQLP